MTLGLSVCDWALPVKHHQRSKNREHKPGRLCADFHAMRAHIIGSTDTHVLHIYMRNTLLSIPVMAACHALLSGTMMMPSCNMSCVWIMDPHARIISWDT